MDRRNPGARNPPRARGPGRTPALKKARRGRLNKTLGRPACGVPAVLSPRPHRRGRFQPPRPPLFGDPLRGHPFRDDLRGAFSALWARPARSGRGADVFGLSRQAPCGAFRNSPAVAAAARVGRHRAPAAGPPPLRLHDPVRTRLLAGGECRQMNTDGNTCQGLFSTIFPKILAAPSTVMAGLGPAIHAFASTRARRPDMSSTQPGQSRGCPGQARARRRVAPVG